MHSTLSLLAGFQLAVAVLLAIVPFISATHSQNVVHRNEPMDSPQWPSLGCFTDSPNRTLTSASIIGAKNLTVENCIYYCNNQSYTYAGVENGNECYCGNMVAFGAEGIPQANCSSQCAGNATESCGGIWSLDLYWSGLTPLPQPNFVPNSHGWYYYGCYNDTNGTTLNVPVQIDDNNPNDFDSYVEECVEACAAIGFEYAGVSFPEQCFCGGDINNSTGNQIDLQYCVLGCFEYSSGNRSEACDGADSLAVYYNYTT
ncbi:WSC domain-containing protein [Lactarius quietus]|nr:WSC domain-containing protein [Lactarius quietus]